MHNSVDRRRFLTGAALGGATIVGASALGGLDADAAFAAPQAPIDKAITKTSFAEGRIAAIKGSTLSVHGSYGERHLIQLTNATSIWKLTHTTASAIEVGDGMYARGVPLPDGTIAADAVWVNIVNLSCTIRGLGKDRISLQHGNHALVGRVVHGTTVASYADAAPTTDLSRLKLNQAVQVLGAWRPSDDGIDIARLMSAH
jgi:hypothetical protein